MEVEEREQCLAFGGMIERDFGKVCGWQSDCWMSRSQSPEINCRLMFSSNPCQNTRLKNRPPCVKSSVFIYLLTCVSVVLCLVSTDLRTAQTELIDIHHI